MRHFKSFLCAVGMLIVAGAPVNAAEPPNQVVLGNDSRIRVVVNNSDWFMMNPVGATPDWQFGTSRPATLRPEGDTRNFTMTVGGQRIEGEAQAQVQDGASNLQWVFVPQEDMQVAALAISADFSVASLAGGVWQADDQSGQFPQELGEVHLFSGAVQNLRFDAQGRSVVFNFPQPTIVLIQDNRRWSENFSVRIGLQGANLTQGQRIAIPISLRTSSGPFALNIDAPVTITAGDDWIVLNTELEIEPGSALDLSHLNFVDAPAGKHGWIQTNGRHFVFENKPDQPQRFYGVNFCFNAHFIPHEQIDRLLDRLVRLGYNTLRIHHHEIGLTNYRPGFDWIPERIDQLDYLLAASKKRGIYVTKDLYVSRPISAEQVQMPDDGRSWQYRVKVLIPVHEPAFADWEYFTRKILDRVNPYTGLRWADDPTLAWLSMINEGNIANFWSDVLSIPQWTTAWNAWLVQKYPNRAALAAAWGAELRDDEDPANGTVALPRSINGDNPRIRDCTIFIADKELAMYQRMERVIRDLGSRALLTNMNGWTNHAPNQLVRTAMDYVDDHFYVDHPVFLERDWQLPSRSGNENPVSQGAPGGRAQNLVGLLDRPFTISEYNYSGPGRFRGVGGILTGAMGALQDWGVIWRFAYSHTDRTLFTPGTMGYFDLVSDPLNQAADRAAVMLFLRGDLRPADNQVAMVLTQEDLRNPPSNVPSIHGGPNYLAWVTRIGSLVVDDRSQAPANSINLFTGWNDRSQPVAPGLTAFNTNREALMSELRSRGVISADNPTNPARNIFMSETGELLLDGPRALLQFDTYKTAGGYVEPGHEIHSQRGGVRIGNLSIGATVFVTAVDDRPIRSSNRILVTHLTDLQNTDIQYAESARQTLLAWGRMPHLVRHGTAEVAIEVDQPGPWKVYSLSTSGRRLGEVPYEMRGNALVFTCDVRGPDGARMLYEVVRE